MSDRDGSTRWRVWAQFASLGWSVTPPILLVLVLTLGGLLVGSVHTALACGLANTPTMIANSAPAIPTPVTPNSDPNQPVGFFPGAYYVNQPIAFTEDLSSVPNAPPLASLQLRWDFADGSAPIIGTAPHHTYQQPGSYPVRVTIYDQISQNWNDFDSATITVLAHAWSQPPIAKASADHTTVTINQLVTFDATGSYAQLGTIVSYTWNFGDTQEGQGLQVTHAFSIPGRALVTLIVTDSRGASSTAVVPIQVVATSTHVAVQVSASQGGQTLTFVAAPVDFPSSDPIVVVTWDFGDQTPPVATSMLSITHHYAAPGRYTVQVQALDVQHIVRVATLPIVVLAGPAGSGTTQSARALPVWLGVSGAGLLMVSLAGGVYAILSWRRKRVQSAE
jgi:PKD repeat protein